MSGRTGSGEEMATTRTRNPGRRPVAVLMWSLLWATILLAAAGTVQWTRAWVYLGVYLAGLLANLAATFLWNRRLLEVRSSDHPEIEPWDKIFAMLYAPSLFVLPLVAGLDAARFRWTHLPPGAMYLGLALLVMGSALVTWTMASNPYLEKTVRYQEDRGQRVIAHGPCALVRHPMYSGAILQQLAVPLVLGSAWALAVVAWQAGLFVYRTAHEDKFLQDKLEGYLQCTECTRFRLVPGLW